MTDERSSKAAKEASLRSHTSQALVAADCAERVLALFESRVPNDDRPRKAIDAARAWARSEIRVGAARTAALSAHAAARDAAGDPAACAAARAAGHAAATAHVVTHARAVSLYADRAVAALAHMDGYGAEAFAVPGAGYGGAELSTGSGTHRSKLPHGRGRQTLTR